MRAFLAALLLVLNSCNVNCNLWKKGVVHYTINQKDYDLHSQDVITSVFEAIQREVCVKFFHSSASNVTDPQNTEKILYISNPDRIKSCPPIVYNYTGNVVDMPIGYKCLNTKEVSRIIVDMLRASIDQSDPITSYDIMKKYRERDHDPSSTLLTPDDRNFINAHYYAECGSLAARPFAVGARRTLDSDLLSGETAAWYNRLLWPLGVVMYGVAPSLRGSPAHSILKFAMTTIELSSCVVFQYQDTEKADDVLAPKNFLWFGRRGDESPELGFREGNQSIELVSMVRGAAGHTAHALNNLLRALGVPMASNRYDRDNYVNIHWKYVEKGKEHLLEKMPEVSWIPSILYDFNSATHAPANYACKGCQLGQTTVQPIQDHLWQRSLSMGHRTSLSESDIKLLNLLYAKECQKRLQ